VSDLPSQLRSDFETTDWPFHSSTHKPWRDIKKSLLMAHSRSHHLIPCHHEGRHQNQRLKLPVDGHDAKYRRIAQWLPANSLNFMPVWTKSSINNASDNHSVAEAQAAA
jgi:hypothetical protein